MGDDQTMYPGDALLVEVGRVAIAGARLEIWMGFHWWHLNPAVDELRARKSSFRAQREAVLALAEERLHEGPLRESVLAVVAAAKQALDRRHEVIHQDWVLNTQEHIRAEDNLLRFFGPNLADNMDHVERYAHDSDNWSRMPARELKAEDALTRTELVQVERQLSQASQDLLYVVRDVASARQADHPPVYRRGPLWG